MCWYQLDHTNKNCKTNPGIPLPRPVLGDLGAGEVRTLNSITQLLTPAHRCRHSPESLSREARVGMEGAAVKL